MKIKTKEYEIFVDGKLVRVIKGKGRFERHLSAFNKKMRKKGYREILTTEHSDKIYVNAEKQKSLYFSTRMWFGFRDCEGNKIYDGDELTNKNGDWVEIEEPYWDFGSGKYIYINHSKVTLGTYVKKDITNMDFIKEEGVKIVRNKRF